MPMTTPTFTPDQVRELTTPTPMEKARILLDVQDALNPKAEVPIPTGWQICALIFDILKGPGGPAGIENWRLNGWHADKDDDNSVDAYIVIGDGNTIPPFVISITHHDRRREQQSRIAAELGMDLRHFHLMASMIHFPLNPPAIAEKGLLLWMPSRDHYIPAGGGTGSVTLDDLRKARWGRDFRIVSWK